VDVVLGDAGGGLGVSTMGPVSLSATASASRFGRWDDGMGMEDPETWMGPGGRARIGG